MDSRKVAPIAKVGPLGIGRKVIGEFEPLSSITLKSGYSTFEDGAAGEDVRFDPERGLEIYHWSEDVLGYNTEILKRVPFEEVNQEPKLKNHLYYVPGPERR